MQIEGEQNTVSTEKIIFFFYFSYQLLNASSIPIFI